MSRCLIRGRNALAALLTASLGACVVQPPRPSPAPATPPASAPMAAAPSPPAEHSAPPAESPSPWVRLRARFAMQGCDYRPQVQRWAQVYTRSPRHFSAQWRTALPFVELVVDEIEKRDLPGEFAMLPFVESDYRPIDARGDRAAGMWQFVPDTARTQNLPVGDDYDGRLDALASTQAALDLLDRYYREFADWRLVDFAYNSGEFRVKKLLGERDPRTLSADELARLPVNKVTHDHLDRLLALTCIVDDPARFGVQLPESSADTRLVVVDLQAGMDLRLVARLTGLPISDVRRWNAGHRHDRMDETAPRRLLLPESRIEQFHAASAAIPVAFWNDWHEQRATHGGTLDSWAGATGIPLAALAAANAMAIDASVTRNTTLLLPGRESRPVSRHHASRLQDDATSRVHTIAAGDTLSSIARRYRIPLRRLQALNPQAQGTLRIGMRLRLDASAS